MTETLINTGKVLISILEEGIIENAIQEGVIIDVEDVKKMKEANMELSAGKPYCVLVRSGVMAQITKEAKELSASKEFQQRTIAKALWIESTAHRIVGNLYLRWNKPAIKTQIFSDKQKAVEWLRKQLGK